MSVQNNANRANFEELEGHCKLLSAKLSTMTNGNAPVQTALEDLEDYYERAIQMRIMHNTTLREEISELRRGHSDFSMNILLIFAFFMCVFFFYGCFHFPELIFYVISEYWTYVIVGGLSFWGSQWVGKRPKQD